jgi:hypothetical protein
MSSWPIASVILSEASARAPSASTCEVEGPLHCKHNDRHSKEFSLRVPPLLVFRLYCPGWRSAWVEQRLGGAALWVVQRFGVAQRF